MKTGTSLENPIAQRGVDASKLGRHRWVVERTPARLSRYRRLKVRYERRVDAYHVVLELLCTLVLEPRAAVLLSAALSSA